MVFEAGDQTSSCRANVDPCTASITELMPIDVYYTADGIFKVFRDLEKLRCGSMANLFFL